MKTHGRITGWLVSNKLRDGEQDACIKITVEVPFAAVTVTSLGKITLADAISITLEKSQRKLEFGKDAPPKK